MDLAVTKLTPRFVTFDARLRGARFERNELAMGVLADQDNPAPMALSGWEFETATLVCTPNDLGLPEFTAWLYIELCTRFGPSLTTGAARLTIQVMV